MEENSREKHFSITDPKNVNTIIYQVNETEPEFWAESPKFTIERLNFVEQPIGENKRKTFLCFSFNKTLEIQPYACNILIRSNHYSI